MVQGTRIGGKRVTFGLMVMLCFAMISSLFGLQMNTAKVYANVSFSGGDGTTGNPYIVTTPEQLDAIRNFPSKSYKLGNSIDLTDYLATGGDGYNNGAFWNPIGSGAPFAGTFDGDGYVIKGLKINRQMNFCGFFGVAGTGATIKNIGLENVDVVAGTFAGGLAGSLGDGATISSSYVTGNVSGTIYVGGLVGYQNHGSISDSYSSATVVSTGTFAGGLVGYEESGSTISRSYATGHVTGGLPTGGLVASYMMGGATSSFYDQSSTGQDNQYNGIGTPKSTLEMQTQSTFDDWDFDTTWHMTPNQYPQLRTFITQTPVATPDSEDGPVAWQSSVTITSGTAGASIYYTTNGDNPTTSSTLYSSPVVVDDDLTIKAIAVYSGKPDSEIMSKSYTILRAAAPTTGTLAMGTNSGTTVLLNVTDDMEYKVNSGVYEEITDTSVDNITVNAGDTIYVRIAATAQQPASDVQELTVGLADIKPAEAPAGTLAPGSDNGTTKLSNVTNAMEYSLDDDVYTRILTGTSVDNISVDAGDTIYVRIAATAQQPASDVQELTVNPADIKQASNVATLTSTIGTVSTGGTANETITNIPYGTTLAALKAAITPAANATFEVYDADGTTVATTLATGKKVIVTAEDEATTVTYTVTVKAQSPSIPSYYPVTDVSLDQQELILTAGGETAVLHATINPSYASVQSVTWSSSDSKVATVDDKGVVTPIAAGTATITVTTTDQAKTAKSRVKVVEKDVNKLVGLEVSERSVLLKPNKSSSLTVHAIYSDGTKEDITKDKEVTYRTSSKTNASVTQGVIKAGKKEGKATITIRYQGKKVEIPVVISKLDVTKLEIQPADLQVEVDQVEQLTLTATLSNKKTQDVTEQAVWESSDPTVVTVDENGKLTAIAAGSAVITAAYGGEIAEITVDVGTTLQVKRLSASKQKVTVAAGKEQSIKLTATYQDNSRKVVTEQAKWSSEDETIATVKNGVITGQGKGTVKIQAKYKGKTVTITVTVTK